MKNESKDQCLAFFMPVIELRLRGINDRLIGFYRQLMKDYISFVFIIYPIPYMKKLSALLILVLSLSISLSAQHAAQVTYQHSFTKTQVDSILRSVGLPGGIFTTNYGVKTYKVIYNTYDADSVPTTASGLMVVPQGTPCKRPLFSYQHNNIIRKQDAPSFYRNEWFVGLAAASIGFVTVLPDYLGLGSGPGFHPYLHLQTEATAVIDMIRAAKEVVDTTGASVNKKLFLGGLSEGAYASLAAHQYIQTYLDSSMHVTATGAISGYYDMSGTMVNMMLSDSNYVDPSYLPYLLTGYNSVYHFYNQDSDIYVHPYDSILPPLFNGQNRNYQINAYMPSVPKHILRQDQIDSLQNDSTNFIRMLLKKNDAYNWSPTSPIKLFYCPSDAEVPYQNSIAAYTHFAQNGSTMVDTLNVGSTLDHNLCTQFSLLAVVNLFTSYVGQPLSISVAISNDTSTTQHSGTGTVTPTDGDAPYTIRWSTGDSTATIQHLAAGKYYVTVTDMSGCTKTDSIVVRQVAGIEELTLSNIKVYPNPAQGVLVVENQNATEKLDIIELLDINGQAIRSYPIADGNTTKLYFDDTARGIYLLHLRSHSGKELRQKVVLM
jgi:hypothetical protein